MTVTKCRHLPTGTLIKHELCDRFDHVQKSYKPLSFILKHGNLVPHHNQTMKNLKSLTTLLRSLRSFYRLTNVEVDWIQSSLGGLLSYGPVDGKTYTKNFKINKIADFLLGFVHDTMGHFCHLSFIFLESWDVICTKFCTSR